MPFLLCRKVWNALTGDILHSFEHKHIVRACAFSEVNLVLFIPFKLSLRWTSEVDTWWNMVGQIKERYGVINVSTYVGFVNHHSFDKRIFIRYIRQVVEQLSRLPFLSLLLCESNFNCLHLTSVVLVNSNDCF